MLKTYDGLTDVFYPAVPATALSSKILCITSFFKNETLTNVFQAKEFIIEQLLRETNYIKLIIEPFSVVESNLTIKSLIVKKIIKIPHNACKCTIAHAADIGLVKIVLAAGAGEIHHAVSNYIVNKDIISKFFKGNVVFTFTLTKMP